jgi:hypothetical protein
VPDLDRVDVADVRRDRVAALVSAVEDDRQDDDADESDERADADPGPGLVVT